MRMSPTQEVGQAVERALLEQDRVEVGQDLGRVLAPAVAAVDDRHGRPLGGLGRGALLEVTDRDDVRVVLQHVEGVLDRLLVEVAGAGHLRVGEAQHLPAEAMHGGLVGEARPGARLVERRQERLVLEQVRVAPVAGERAQVVGDLEDPEELVPAEVLEREDVATGETAHYQHLPMVQLLGLKTDPLPEAHAPRVLFRRSPGSTRGADSAHERATTSSASPRPAARPAGAGPSGAWGASWFTRRMTWKRKFPGLK